MAKAVLDADRCHPDVCPSGRCLARPSCPVKAVWQEEAFEPPYLSAGVCHGCGKCVAACPIKAISLV